MSVCVYICVCDEQIDVLLRSAQQGGLTRDAANVLLYGMISTYASVCSCICTYVCMHDQQIDVLLRSAQQGA